MKAFPLRPETTQRGPLSLFLLNLVQEVLTRVSSQEKEIKGIWIRKAEVKLSLCAESLKLLPKKEKITSKLINEYSKAVGYKINIQKSITFLNIYNNLKKILRKQSHLQLYHQ